METQTNYPVCISGNPSEDEVVAITAAYTWLLRQIGDKSGDNAVEIMDYWTISAKNRIDDRARCVGLPGEMSSWQQNLRFASRM